MSIIFGFAVDWSGDGDYSDTGENTTTRTLGMARCARGSDGTRPFTPPKANTSMFRLDNTSGDYYPDNTASPLTGTVQPGRMARIQATYSASTRNLYAGYITGLRFEFGLSTSKNVKVSLTDVLGQIRGVNVSSAPLAGKDCGELIEKVLELAGVDSGLYTSTVETGTTILPHWWADGDDAFGLLADLVAAEGPHARLFVDGQGRIVFHNRHHRIFTTASNTSQATFGDSDIGYSLVDYDVGWHDIANDVTVSGETYTAAVVVEDLLDIADPVGLAASETRTYYYEVSKQSSTLTVDCTVTVGSGTHVSTQLSAKRVKLVLTAGGSGMQVTINKVEGTPYTSTSWVVSHTDSTSQTSYGVKSYPKTIKWVTRNDAEVHATELLLMFKDPLASWKFTVKNGDAARIGEQLDREVSDRVTITDDETSFDGDVWIEAIEHDIRAAGTYLATTFAARELSGTSEQGVLMILDDALNGKLDTGTLSP